MCGWLERPGGPSRPEAPWNLSQGLAVSKAGMLLRLVMRKAAQHLFEMAPAHREYFTHGVRAHLIRLADVGLNVDVGVFHDGGSFAD